MYSNHWALGLIVRDHVMLILIAECSCLAHNCVQACYRKACNSLTVVTYCRCLRGGRIILQTSRIVLPKYMTARHSIAQDSSLHSQCYDVMYAFVFTTAAGRWSLCLPPVRTSACLCGSQNGVPRCCALCPLFLLSFPFISFSFLLLFSARRHRTVPVCEGQQ